MSEHTYNAKDIQVLEGLDAVRMRPGMYIGTTGSKGLHHLLWEIVDNAVDEASNGYADKVDIAILSVPRRAAQELTDRLIGAGIRGIWNFTNIELETGDSGVLVENIHFSDSFLALTYYLAEEDDDRK